MTLVKQQKVEALKAKGFRFSVDHLTPDQFSQLVDVLHDFRHVFATELHEMRDLKDCQYDIQLKDGAKPVRPRQYRYPPACPTEDNSRTIGSIGTSRYIITLYCHKSLWYVSIRITIFVLPRVSV